MTGWVTLGTGERRALAGFDRRLAARIIDWILIGAAVYLLWLPFSSRIDGWFGVLFYLALICLILGLAYEVVLTALFGQTLGKKAFGVKVVRAADGRPPGWGRSLGRYLTLNLANLLPVLGNAVTLFVYLSPVFSDLLQGLHDKAAAVVVIETRRSGLPAEAPAETAVREAALAAAGTAVLSNGEQHRLAGFGRRLSARLIDFVILTTAAALVLLLWLTWSINSIQQVIEDSLQQLSSSMASAADSLDMELMSDAGVMDILGSLWDSLQQLWRLFVQSVEDVLSAFVSALRLLLTTLIGIAAGAVLYEILMTGLLGRTLGKMIVRAKVVRAADGRAPGLVKGVIRYLSLHVPLISPLIYLSPAFYDSRRGWHDRAASTLVIRQPRRRSAETRSQEKAV